MKGLKPLKDDCIRFCRGLKKDGLSRYWANEYRVVAHIVHSPFLLLAELPIAAAQQEYGS
jgi:hypothetical protein